MPFVAQTDKLIGSAFRVVTEDGYGWTFIRQHDVEAEGLDVPGPDVPERFELTMEGVLFDGGETRALIGNTTFEFRGKEFRCAAFIPRTDDFVDLLERGVTCNILITNQQPCISADYPYDDPKHVSVGYPHIRGFGRLSLRR